MFFFCLLFKSGEIRHYVTIKELFLDPGHFLIYIYVYTYVYMCSFQDIANFIRRFAAKINYTYSESNLDRVGILNLFNQRFNFVKT